jgi:hypothetical protein
MGSLISTFEGSYDIVHNNTTADKNFFDMIDKVSFEINLRFVKVRISEVNMY